MKLSLIRPAVLAAVALIAANATAQTRKPNQTLGYGENKILTFTYTQSFACIDQPYDDLNYNGIIAAKDPGEQQTPICQVGTNPTINPPGQVGNPLSTTEPIYVLVPLFSVNNDQNPNDAVSCDNVVTGTLCGPALGTGQGPLQVDRSGPDERPFIEAAQVSPVSRPINPYLSPTG